LVNGGYIFIHDFNNEQYKGARKAVEQFCKEQHINFVPIADSAGTAIITK
jgi:O-methyltransferase